MLKPHFTRYKGLWIMKCRVSLFTTDEHDFAMTFWRVKENLEDDHALHHGSFASEKEARSWIDDEGWNADEI